MITHCISLYVKTLEEGVSPSFDLIHSRFLQSGEEGKLFRKQRFKYLAQLPTAPFIVSTSVAALGGYRPVIMVSYFVFLNITQCSTFGLSRILIYIIFQHSFVQSKSTIFKSDTNLFPTIINYLFSLFPFLG